MFSIKLSFHKKWEIILATAVLVSISIMGVVFLVFFNHYENKIYPGIFVNEENLEGLSKEQAIKLISKNHTIPKHNIEVFVDDIKIASDSSQLEVNSNITEVVDKAYSIAKKGPLSSRIWKVIELLNNPQHLYSEINYNQLQIKQMVFDIKQKVDTNGNKPFAELTYSGSPTSIKIDPGQDFREVDLKLTISKISKILKDGFDKNGKIKTNSLDFKIEAIVASTSAQLSELQTEEAKNRALVFIDQKASFKGQRETVFITDQEFINILDFPEGINQTKLNQLITAWNTKISREPQNAQFEYNTETLEVTTFTPPQDGLILDLKQTKKQITELISKIELSTKETINSSQNNDQSSSQNTKPKNQHELDLKMEIKPASVSLEKTNNLGIKELIGFGESYYPHSIPGRIHNVSVTTKKISLNIIKPGDEFSFNKTLGEVSSRTGFKAAYVIKNGKTELGDGGGVCQVSTTLFRSLLDSGLPITKRKPHSYRVSYYEENNKAGFDATVYSGDVDLRFLNDTGHHVLIYGEADSENVYMKIELYGTNDGRTTEVVDYKKWGYSPPLAPVYIPDPSLPKGAKRQIDWSQSGLKTSFVHVVKDKEGNTLREDKYSSSYRPWSAKFLVGI